MGDFVSENLEQNPSALSGTPHSQGSSPLLLLPFTLEYLVPLIREYLGDIAIEILYPEKSFSLK